ncbi:MAG: PaaI family thioesterase [Lentisphaerae bacterium]|nr:PaaI family thioesterase [Lentisphaerota bacterium]
MDCEKLRDFLNNNDLFCRYCGIKITHIAPGEAEAELQITPDMMNSRNVVQGGAIMTLADFAFAGASNAMGHTTVSTGLNINFLRPGSGKKLIAKAKKIHHGRSTCLYQVDVFNEENKLVAAVTVSGFTVDDKPVAG